MKLIYSSLIKLLFYLLITFIYCEYIIYYVVIYQCNYKKINNEEIDDGLKTMILADTHMLGPFRGHPIDKLRREWQMRRSFQTSIQLFNPDVVIILGDVFDEGNWVDQKGFNEYVERFYSIFTVPSATKVYAVHGNHDVNFHYRMHSYLISRFNQAFNTSGVRIIRESKTTLAGVKRAINFVTLNSMALERDGCALCNEAEYEIKSIKKRLEKLKQIQKYSNPIILQHFPTFRENDDKCIETNSINHDKYREKWETLSKDATKFIADNLNPRLYLSGHSHHYCQLKNSQNTEEYTVASFNWRNLNNPSFLLAIFTPEDFTLSLCELPKETTVFTCYILGIIFSLILVIFHRRKCKLNFKKLI